jgi:ABC-type bacteriocin/lantibiotic exporter with double-glycine peptidase domain
MDIIEREFNAEPVPTSKDISKFLEGKKKFDMPASWFKSQKAHQWLLAMMLLVTFLLLILTLVSPFILQSNPSAKIPS